LGARAEPAAGGNEGEMTNGIPTRINDGCRICEGFRDLRIAQSSFPASGAYAADVYLFEVVWI